MLYVQQLRSREQRQHNLTLAHSLHENSESSNNDAMIMVYYKIDRKTTMTFCRAQHNYNSSKHYPPSISCYLFRSIRPTFESSYVIVKDRVSRVYLPEIKLFVFIAHCRVDIPYFQYVKLIMPRHRTEMTHRWPVNTRPFQPYRYIELEFYSKRTQ